MAIKVKVPPVDKVMEFFNKEVPALMDEAALAGVNSVTATIVRDLELAYRTLPVKHVAAQARHAGRPVFRRSGAPRPHVWADIAAKSGNYRELFGAWAVIGSRDDSPFTANQRQPHLHLIEGGTKQRFTKLGQNRGVMPAFRVVATVRNNRMDYIIATMTEAFVAKYNSVMAGK